MGLPTSLVGQADQTIGSAMSTGGRGSQTFTTDYTPLSNAFMKKAQLDMNLADLHSSNTNQRANLLAGLDMDKANLHMQQASMQMQQDQYNDQIRREEKANKLNGMEQLTGVLAGAASGAAGGAAFGPKGMIVGAVLGGVTTMGAGNNRAKQQSAISNVGIIANAASSIKGTLDAKAGRDAMGTRMDDIANASTILRNAAPGSAEHTSAQNTIDTSINGFVKESIKTGVPLHQAVNSGAEMRKMALNGYDASDPKQKYTRQFEQKMMAGSSDPAVQDPRHPGHRAAVEGLKSDLATSYQMAHGGKVSKGMAKNWLNQVGSSFETPNAAFGTDHYKGGGSTATAPTRNNSGTQVRSDSGIASMDAPVHNARAGSSTVTAGADRSGAPVQRPQGSIGDSFGVMAPPSGGGSGQYGVTMDNMESITQGRITEASTAMSKDPSIAAKALGQDEPQEKQSFMQKMTTPYKEGEVAQSFKDAGAKIKHNLGLSDEEFGANKQPVFGGNERQAMEAPSPSSSPSEPIKRSSTGTAEPEISSQRPETAKKERVFKTATDADDMLDTFGLRGGKYADRATNDKVVGLANAATELNSFEKLVLDETKNIEGMSVNQRRAFQTYLQGKGEGAMEGSGGGLTASGMGFSGGGNFNSFKRNLQLQMEGRGDKTDLTDSEIKGLWKIKSKAEPVARAIAMEFNKGTLTSEDVQGFYDGLYNMFEPDSNLASAGLQGMKESLWKKFQFTSEGSATRGAKERETLDMARRKYDITHPPKQNDEAKLDDDFI